MISEIIVQRIKENAVKLSDRVIEEILTREETKGYRTLDRHVLYRRIYNVYSMLDAWLSGSHVKGEIKTHYTELGRQRFQEEIPLEEVLMALMLIKRHLWLFVQEQNFFDTTFMFHQALEFNNRVVLFFDRAIYFTAMGYQEELHASLGRAQRSGFLSKIPMKKQTLPDEETYPEFKRNNRPESRGKRPRV